MNLAAADMELANAMVRHALGAFAGDVECHAALFDHVLLHVYKNNVHSEARTIALRAIRTSRGHPALSSLLVCALRKARGS